MTIVWAIQPPVSNQEYLSDGMRLALAGMPIAMASLGV